MSGSGPNRKLAAILSADVVGYSRLMVDDEAATVETLNEYRTAIGRVIDRHGGRIVNAPGDNILADFGSAVGAVSAAVEIQKSIEGRNIELPEHRRMPFRIGVNLGDVIEESDGTIYGDGVNIAARMEALADAGAICISNAVFESVENKLDLDFESLGEQRLKNMPKPIRAFAVRADRASGEPSTTAAKSAGTKHGIGLTAAMAAMALLLAVVGFWLAVPGSEPPDPGSNTVDFAASVPAGPSIAVLPFNNLSGDEEQEYFSDGLTEEIINGLTQYQELLVVARNSTFQFKGHAVDVRAVGRDLDVDYVVQGSVRKASNTIRVSTQLLDARSGSNIWAETYDRALTAANVFAVQDEIREKIVNTVGDAYGAVYRAEIQKSKRKQPESLESYDCVLKGYEFRSVNYSPESHLELRSCFEAALEREPDFADGWAWMAYIFNQEHQFGFNSMGPDTVERMRAAAARGVQLNPRSARAHAQLAEAHFFAHDIELFWPEAERALQLQPNNLAIVVDLAHRMGIAGDPERSIALTRKAMALNPNHPTWYYFNFWNYYYWKEDWHEALTWAERIDFDNLFWTHACLAATYGQLDRPKEAAAALQKLLQVYPGFNTTLLRQELDKWNWATWQTDLFADGLVKAGLRGTQPAN